MDLHLGGGHRDSFGGRNNLFGMNIGVDERMNIVRIDRQTSN
jgi:hypothetical protein